MGKKMSIIAFVLSLLFFVPFAPIIGLILGIVDLVKKDEDSIKGLTIAAIVIGFISSFFNIIGTLAYFGFFAAA